MKVKALISFAGTANMGAGEIKDITDEYVLNDLLQAGYVEAVKDVAKSTKGESSANEPKAEEVKKGKK